MDPTSQFPPNPNVLPRQPARTPNRVMRTQGPRAPWPDMPVQYSTTLPSRPQATSRRQSLSIRGSVIIRASLRWRSRRELPGRYRRAVRGRPADNGEYKCLGHELADDPVTSSAHRNANRKLLLPIGGSDRQQRGEVQAADNQNDQQTATERIFTVGRKPRNTRSRTLSTETTWVGKK